MLVKIMDMESREAGKLLDRLLCDTAQDIQVEKLNCAEDRHVRWTTYQNLKLWFDSWEKFLVKFEFATYDTDGELIINKELMHQILNMDETCISLNGSNGNRGGRPTVTYYNIGFPQLRRATSKSALMTTMISVSNTAGEPIPPHFQFQMAAQTNEAKAICVETIWYMLDVQATFGYMEVQSFPVLIGLNSKGGMDDEEFFEYLQKSIMKLYPDAAPVKGKWVIIKCDSGPGRMNAKLLAYLQFHGFLLFPGVPNTTAVTQETDQSYGPFQSAFRTNLQLLIGERIRKEKPMSLSPWIVGLVVFGGCNPETELIVRSAFQEGFSHVQNIRAWENVCAVPLSRK